MNIQITIKSAIITQTLEPNMELHIFTNCTDIILTKRTIVETYDSFKETFGELTPTIWLDPNPNKQCFEYYLSYLKNAFPNSTINVTTSLSNGYIKMIQTTNSDYLFVLEHDWVFLKENIKHTLDEICQQMQLHFVSHMRFNRHHNSEGFEMPDYDAKPYNDFFCVCESASNNPHVINVSEYRKTAFKYLREDIGSLGVEHNLRKVDCKFMIYGDINTPATIIHSDGRLN